MNWLATLPARLDRWPDGWVRLLGRLAVGLVFWLSGQTKVEGLVLDPIHATVELGWPRLSPAVVDLFRDEYRLPLLPPELAATLAATGEHLLPLMLVLGLGTRFAALGLLAMTAVIQFLVYPGAFPTHGTWAAVLLWLVLRGPGPLALDGWIAARTAAR
ncbi:DoxX family protein [Piscinibacter sakaiensis]|uniref:Integral membrane protein, rhomboid family n=1 Tax=Piscinibacter sakaiensis TaxID=1547922 RepID=A0A0K8P225_PISS1|nr:DoxX family protein [Piscinibacter sakaiensis]GAP36681.1 integral membrane protein, rhomboid family [Piscinibacter sakaiensis]